MEIRRTDEKEKALQIAKSLPEYFNADGLQQMEKDLLQDDLWGIYDTDQLVGFASYKEYSPETIEMTWLGVSPEYQHKGFGKELVQKSLEGLDVKYKVCTVKTLADKDNYEPYRKTREFYVRFGFLPIITIDPYQPWGNNACQVFAKFL